MILGPVQCGMQVVAELALLTREEKDFGEEGLEGPQVGQLQVPRRTAVGEVRQPRLGGVGRVGV